MSQARVYIIDDDENACKVAKRALENAGFDVRASSQVIGTTAAINDFRPHVVLLDVMMPALSGDKLVELFSTGLKVSPKIVLYSNKSRDELKRMSHELKVADYLCKIDGPTALVKKIKEHTA